MKVLFLTPTLELHGGNIVMLKYAGHMADAGHEVVIMTTTKPIELPVHEKARIIQFRKFPIKWVDFFLFQLVYLFAVTRQVEDADYIIPIYAPLIVHALYAKRRRKLRAKVVPLFQDSFVTLWVGPYIRRIMASRRLNSGLHALIAISRPIAEQYEKISGYTAILIANGIETEHFYPRKEPKENYVLFAGRPNAPKGFPTFMKAMALVRETYPDMRAKVVAPNIDPREEGLTTYYRYEGRDQLARLFSGATVYANASMAESFALPPLEAMGTGTAVVLTATGGEREYAVDGKNCTIVPIGDVERMAAAICELIGNDKLRAARIRAGLKTAKQYGWTRSLEKFEKTLTEGLEAGK